MVRMIQRVAKMSGVHPNNVEPIYHIYVPGGASDATETRGKPPVLLQNKVMSLQWGL